MCGLRYSHVGSRLHFLDGFEVKAGAGVEHLRLGPINCFGLCSAFSLGAIFLQSRLVNNNFIDSKISAGPGAD